MDGGRSIGIDRLMEVKTIIIKNKTFVETVITDRLIGGGCLIGGHLTDVRLYYQTRRITIHTFLRRSDLVPKWRLFVACRVLCLMYQGLKNAISSVNDNKCKRKKGSVEDKGSASIKLLKF